MVTTYLPFPPSSRSNVPDRKAELDRSLLASTRRILDRAGFKDVGRHGVQHELKCGRANDQVVRRYPESLQLCDLTIERGRSGKVPDEKDRRHFRFVHHAGHDGPVDPAVPFEAHPRLKTYRDPPCTFVTACTDTSDRKSLMRFVSNMGSEQMNSPPDRGGAAACRSPCPGGLVATASSYASIRERSTLLRCLRNPSGLRLLRRLRLGRTVERDRLENERLEGGLVNLYALLDVDRTAHVAVETRVEETGRILEGRALGKGQLHDTLVGFARADDAVVRPDGRAHPLPLLDDVRVCCLDELAHPAEGFPAPVPELGDSLRDELRCRLVLACARLFHGLFLECPFLARGEGDPSRQRAVGRVRARSRRRDVETLVDADAARRGVAVDVRDD